MPKIKTKKEIKYLATCVVHWPSGPVYACDEHAKQIIGLSKFMGGHTVATRLRKKDIGQECSNCINESNTKN